MGSPLNALDPPFKPEPSAAAGTQGRPADLRFGLEALAVIARPHQIVLDPQAARHELGLGPSDPLQLPDLLRAAKSRSLKARAQTTSAERVAHTPLPCLALMRDGTVAVVAQCDGDRVLLQSFAASAPTRPTIEPLKTFGSQWTGQVVLVTGRASTLGNLATSALPRY